MTTTAPEIAHDTDIVPLDLCRLAPKKGASAFQRQRVVMLDLAPDPSLQSGPEVESVKRGDKTVEVPRSVFRTLDVFGHAREVLKTVFPMKRHYLVYSKETPGPEFTAKKPIAVARAQHLLGSDPHVAYSVGCADWLVAPFLTREEVVWSKEPREKTVYDDKGNSHKVSYEAWNVSVPFKAQLEVYRREGDSFVHHASLTGRPAGTAADEALDWSNPQELYRVVSVAMPVGCVASGAPLSGEAIQRCGGRWLDLSPKDATPTLGGFLRNSVYCRDLDDTVHSSEANMPAVALCELRVAAEYTAVDLQLHGKQMCGWRLYSPLVDMPGRNEVGVTMGRHEGAGRGDYYIAYAATGADGCGAEAEEYGFGRIYALGPGGDAGADDPSEFHFQSGGAMTGVRMEEFALHGLRFALQPSAAIMLAKGDLDSTFTGGALFEFGYDLTRFVPLLDEIWLEAHGGLLFGDETFFPLAAGFETASYFGNTWSLVTGLGFAWTLVSKTLEGTGGLATRDVTVSGGAAGIEGRVGFNYALRPNWHARAMLEVRTGFGSATLESKDLPNYALDGGPLLMSMLTLSMSYTY